MSDLLFTSSKTKNKLKSKKKPKPQISISTPPTLPTDMVFAWGWNGAGACGIKGVSTTTNDSLFEPTRCDALEIQVQKGLVQISAGPFHTTVLDRTGSVFCCGQGDKGQIGRVSLDDQKKKTCLTPTLLPSLTSIRVASIACGAYHTIIVDEDKQAWGLGDNGNGQLGLGVLPCTAKERYIFTPTKMEFTATASATSATNLYKIGIQSAACGFDYTLLLRLNGSVLCTGNGEQGQLGLGYDAEKNCPKSSARLVAVSGILAHVRVVQVECGDSHSLFLTSDGRLFSCGMTSYGRLGHGAQLENDQLRSKPRRIQFQKKQQRQRQKNSASSRRSTRMDMKMDMDMDKIEDNSDSSEREEEEAVVVAAVFAGSASTFCVTSTSDVYGWGCNTAGMLGVGHSNDVLRPCSIAAFNHSSSTLNVRSIGVGSEHTLFLTWSGNVYSCGSSRQGRLGLGPGDVNTEMFDPHLIDIFAREGHAIDSISVGGAHSFAFCKRSAENTNNTNNPGNTNITNPNLNTPSVDRTVLVGVKNHLTSMLSSSDQVVQGPLCASVEWHEVKLRTRDSYGKDCRSGGADVVVSLSTALTNLHTVETVNVSTLDYDADGWSRAKTSTPLSNSNSNSKTTKTSNLQLTLHDLCSELKACDCRDGTYRILFRVNYGGRVELSVTINGICMQNSPYLIEMQRPRDQPVRFVVVEDDAHPKGVRHILAGEKLSFVIEGRSAMNEVVPWVVEDTISKTTTNRSKQIEALFLVNVSINNVTVRSVRTTISDRKDGTYLITLSDMKKASSRQNPYTITVHTNTDTNTNTNTNTRQECIGSPITLYVSPNDIDPTKSTVALFDRVVVDEEAEGKQDLIVPLFEKEDNSSSILTWYTNVKYKYVLHCMDCYSNKIDGRLSDELSCQVTVSNTIKTKEGTSPNNNKILRYDFLLILTINCFDFSSFSIFFDLFRSFVFLLFL
jgi:alpha-tubulin suppressor-like RCC1 family protein